MPSTTLIWCNDTQGIKRITVNVPFATIVSTYSTIGFITSFFSISLYLKLTDEKIC